MILSYVICFIAMLIAHYIGDYFLQSREVAVNKSTSTKHMFSHFTDLYCSFTLAFIILVSIGFLFNSPCFLKAADIMFYIDLLYCIVHVIQDTYIWRFYKKVVIKRVERGLRYEPVIGLTTFEKKRTEALSAFYSDKLYAEDKLFYDFIGLDNLLHILTLTGLIGGFYALFN